MGESEDYDGAGGISPHGTTHQDGGSDKIAVDALLGELAAEQKSSWEKVSSKPLTFAPAAHGTTHQDGGSDKIAVDALLGELAAEQKSAWAKVSGKPTAFAPEAHKISHQDGGSDEFSVEGLAGELTAEQKSAWLKVSGKPTTFPPNFDTSFWGIKNLRIIQPDATGDNTRVVVNPNNMLIPLSVGAYFFVMTAAVNVDSVDDIDTGALAAGTDYYIYACTDGTTLSFKVSANSTVPTGFDAAHSRKIGGFHTLCVAVGAIGGHTLTNYAVKDILPQSIWDLKHRAKSLINVGLVYDSAIQKWVDIYLQSGTGTGTTSVNGGTITDTRNWMDHVDDGNAVGKRLLRDGEFQSIAAGSNKETNIAGSGDPGTTGGHSDTAGRRMISNIGCEDCCGALQQWLEDEAYIYSGTTAYWANLPGGKGSMYTNVAADPGAPEVDNADAGSSAKLLAGGNWGNAAYCGSRCRTAIAYRWYVSSAISARFVSEPL